MTETTRRTFLQTSAAAAASATLLPGDRVRFGDREMTVAREA